MPDCNLYITCDNEQIPVDALIKLLVKVDDNGCAALNIVTDAGGVPAGIATEATLQTLLNQYTGDVGLSDLVVIDGANPAIIASTYNSIQIIVVSGTVTKGAIVYPPGVYNITAPLNKTLPAIVLTGSVGVVAYVNLMTP